MKFTLATKLVNELIEAADEKQRIAGSLIGRVISDFVASLSSRLAGVGPSALGPIHSLREIGPVKKTEYRVTAVHRDHHGKATSVVVGETNRRISIRDVVDDIEIGATDYFMEYKGVAYEIADARNLSGAKRLIARNDAMDQDHLPDLPDV